MIKTVKRLFKRLDVFSEPITLLLYKQKMFSTFSGGCVTIIMVIFLILFSYNEFYALINRTKMSVETSDIVNIEPPKISLKNNFAIDIQPPIFNSLNGKRYFDIQFVLGNYYMSENGDYKSKKYMYNVSYCNGTHFPFFSAEEIEKYSIEKWICPDFGDSADFEITGTFGIGTYSYIQIAFLECQPKGKGDICANQSEIDYLRKTVGQGKIYIDLKIKNNILNFSNFQSPFSPFFDHTQHVLSLNNSYVQKEIYLTSVEFETVDTNFIDLLRSDQNSIGQKEYLFERKIEESIINENIYKNEQKIYFSMYLRSGMISKIYKRSYITLEDFLKVLGSLNNILYVVFFCLHKIICYEKLIMKIGKTIYGLNFKPKKKKIHHQKFLKFFIEKIRDFVISLFKFFKLYQQNKKKLLKEAITKDMDIIQILSKLKEIEIFKRIIFNNDQILLLNFAAKPKIEENSIFKSMNELNYDKKLKQRQIFQEKKIKQSTLNEEEILHSKISQSYKKLMNSNNERDQKILGLLDNFLINQINSWENKSYKKSHFINKKMVLNSDK